MQKPKWKDAPCWARYLAQNDDGQWVWYEKRPSLAFRMGYFFAENGGEYEEAEYADDWHTTLEERPLGRMVGED